MQIFVICSILPCEGLGWTKSISATAAFMAVLQRSVAVRRTSATLLKILESEAAVHHTGGLGWPLNTTRFWEAEHSDSESEGDWKEAIILPKVRPLSPVNTELVRLVPRSAVHTESWRGTISSCKSFSSRPPEPLSPPPIIHPWRRVVVEEETEVAIEEAVDEAAEEGVEEIVEEETGPVKSTGVAPKADPIANIRCQAYLVGRCFRASGCDLQASFCDPQT